MLISNKNYFQTFVFTLVEWPGGHRVFKYNFRFFQDTECQICHKKLRKRNLPGHLKTHEGYDGIPCSVCGKEFPTIGGKNRHEKIHFEVKQHTCRLTFLYVLFFRKTEESIPNDYPCFYKVSVKEIISLKSYYCFPLEMSRSR